MARWKAEFAAWLKEYNEVRPYLGYRNHGKPPLEFARECA